MVSLVMAVYINDPSLGVCDQVMVLVETAGQLSQTCLELVRPAVGNIVKPGLQSSDLGSHGF